MIKLKKLSAIALAAVMAASALTGCGSKKDKSTITPTPTDPSVEQPTTVDTSKETSSDTKDDSNSDKSFGLTKKPLTEPSFSVSRGLLTPLKILWKTLPLQVIQQSRHPLLMRVITVETPEQTLTVPVNGTITISQQTGQSATTSLEQKKNSSPCVKKLTNTE